MPPTGPTPPASLAERAAEVLAGQFPPHLPGKQDGWHIITRSEHLAAVWDLAVKIDVDTPIQAAKREELAQALANAGFAITLTPHFYMVFFADPPDSASGSRYGYSGLDTDLSALFGGNWVVLDTWTGAWITCYPTEAEAEALCTEINDGQGPEEAAVRDAHAPQHPLDCAGGCRGVGRRYGCPTEGTPQDECTGRPYRFTITALDEDYGVYRPFLYTDDEETAAGWANSDDPLVVVRDREYVPPTPPVDLKKYDCPF